MSSRMLNRAWEVELDAPAKLILVYLADGATTEGFVSARSADELADMSGRSVKTARRALAQLRERHMLSDLDGGGWLLSIAPCDRVPPDLLHAKPDSPTRSGKDAPRTKTGGPDESPGSDPRHLPPAPESPPAADRRPSENDTDRATGDSAASESASVATESVPDDRRGAQGLERETKSPPEPAGTDEPAAGRPPPTLTPERARFLEFCAAWSVDSPSEALVSAWFALEKRELRHDRSETHTWPPEHELAGQPFVKHISAMAEQMPEILQASAVAQRMQDLELPGAPQSPADFLQLEAWRSETYQIPLEDVGAPPPPEPSEAELDAMVEEMSRAGPNFRCGRRTRYKDPDTGEPAIEPLSMYRKRVERKYEHFKAEKHYFTE